MNTQAQSMYTIYKDTHFNVVDINEDDLSITYECEVCGAQFTFIKGSPKDNGIDFCPNCNAQIL